MNIEETGKLICNQRKKIGLTQQQLGDRLGVTNTAVSKWERGLSYPDVALLPLLAEELKLTIAEIVCGKKIDTTSEKTEEDTSKEVIAIADKQIKSGKKRFKKIIIILSAIMACLLISFVTTVSVMKFSLYDDTKWQNEIKAYSLDGSCYSLRLKARTGNPDAYYGYGFIVIKDTKKPKNKLLKEVERIAKEDGNYCVNLTGNNGLLIADKDNSGNGYVFIFDRPQRSNNIYFYSVDMHLKSNINENGISMAFPAYLIDEPIFGTIYENLEYHFGYGVEVTEEVKKDYKNRFVDFYKTLSGYEVSASDSEVTVTESKNKNKVKITFEIISGIGGIKVSRF